MKRKLLVRARWLVLSQCKAVEKEIRGQNNNSINPLECVLDQVLVDIVLIGSG